MVVLKKKKEARKFRFNQNAHRPNSALQHRPLHAHRGRVTGMKLAVVVVAVAQTEASLDARLLAASYVHAEWMASNMPLRMSKVLTDERMLSTSQPHTPSSDALE